MRAPVLLLCLAALLPLGAPLHAEEGPPARPLSPAAAGEKVVAAHAKGDAAALRKLAALDQPDPWAVAEVLCENGTYDAALAFSRAALRLDVEKLPGYVASQQARPTAKAERDTLDQAMAAYDAGKFAEALEATSRVATPIDSVTRVRLLQEHGLARQGLREWVASAQALRKAAAAARELGWLAQASWLLGRSSLSYFRWADWSGLLAVCRDRLALDESRGDDAAIAISLSRMGVAYKEMGDFARALSTYERAHASLLKSGNRRGAARTLANIGIAQLRLANYAAAIETHERALTELRALGDRQGEAQTLVSMGHIERDLENPQKALALQREALKVREAIGDEFGIAQSTSAIGSTLVYLGQNEQGLAHLQDGLARLEKLGHRAGVARALGNVGNVHFTLGDNEKALAYHERALEAKQALGDRNGAAITLGNIGSVHAARGDYAKARQHYQRALSAARSVRARAQVVGILQRLAVLHHEAGKAARALSAAQKGVREIEGLLGGLGDEQGASARGQFAKLFAVGTLAAAQEEEFEEVFAFLENGRAGAQRDMLEKRDEMRWKAESLPQDLRKADLDAQAELQRARQAYDVAVGRGKRKEMRTAASRLDDAMAQVTEVTGRIQRALKRKARAFYPRPRTLYDTQSELTSGQALVLYGLCLDEALAMVVRTEDARVVRLGKAADIEAACQSLDATDPDVDAAPALDVLRKKLVVPLKLGDDVTQVLVSPEGPLNALPYGALFARTVSMTPSGTTHALLLGEEHKPGNGILALGDPDYAGISKGAQRIYFKGRAMSPLPATRVEATTVGTTSLLGAEANEGALRKALAREGRWRSVHFACHGLVDSKQPMMSSLALSKAGMDDGFLTATEIFHMRIPADLAVLSACQTARGTERQGEGIMGLTRMFMLSGAPRIVCSLWKVDDKATQALMLKFYELWSPKEGKGLGAAEALRQAQAHIRNQEKWKHPYYWAAWVLWGLPD